MFFSVFVVAKFLIKFCFLPVDQQQEENDKITLGREVQDGNCDKYENSIFFRNYIQSYQ